MPIRLAQDMHRARDRAVPLLHPDNQLVDRSGEHAVVIDRVFVESRSNEVPIASIDASTVGSERSGDRGIDVAR